MTKKKFFSVLLVVCCIMAACAGCGQQNQDQDKQNEPALTTFTSIDGIFQVAATEEWQSMTGELHEEATLEIGSESKNKYLIVIPESKIDLTMTLEEYTDLVKKITSANLKNVQIEESIPLTVNGLNAYSTEITGTVDNVNVAYWVYTIDCPEHFVQLIAWTLKSKQTSYQENIQAVLDSFQVVANQASPAK